MRLTSATVLGQLARCRGPGRGGQARCDRGDRAFVASFNGDAFIGIPTWLAWVAIAIDYLELPVMVDTVRMLVTTLRREGLTGVTNRTETAE